MAAARLDDIYETPKKAKGVFRVFGVLFYVFLALSAVIVCVVGYYGYQLYKELSPQVHAMVDYHPNEVTQVFDAKGRLVANLFDEEYRFYVKYDEIPGRVIEALLAVEDTMFFEHDGVNFDAIMRAIFKNVVNMRYMEGGSTLTQQLVKNMLLTNDRTLDRKLKEFLLSIRAEQVLTKEQILERYLNYIFLGHGYYGIKTAALGYFKKNLDELTLKEIAMLVGLPKSPVKYDPTRHLKNSLNRANAILKRMYDLGWISQSEFHQAVKEVPKVYNQTLTQNKAPYVVDEALRELSNIRNLKSGGYKIYLTIDLDYQEAARAALLKGYENIQYRIVERAQNVRSWQKKPKLTDSEVDELRARSATTLNGAIVVTNPHTGEVLAMVGGIDHNKSSFNRATQTNRQFGSTMKPFVYQLAFDKGYSPAEIVIDSPKRFGGGSNLWQPNNDTRKFLGPVTMQTALEKSLNIPAIDTALKITEGALYAGLESFGFENFPRDLTVVLGSLSMSPMKAAMQYSLFSNAGTIVKPYVVAKIIDPQGKEFLFQTTQHNVTTPQQAFLITSILRNTVQKGTGYRAKVNGLQVAGKTGTSNQSRDVWFCGYTPDLQAIVWYGRDDNMSIGGGAYGGNISAPVFADFMQRALEINPGMQRSFRTPNGVYQQRIGDETIYYTDTSRINYEQIEQQERLKEADNIIF
ncbi:penicillin-binding protein 1A [Helicobacter trogontum]|uniref:PBP1A family penicillin-binding protein n=1 Tax=Helicobacter trogontum TaxID=50960 RepID=A0A4U8TGX9_9HELI|nr:PBP1A family penicillin-binding protein [Helicobacter trogontum]MDY5184327.1 PBP1A family penicillin-binding protein [Helicobacter trogontum]TLD98017.1 PBP1A family penicillin-binding protein [Helicobacter trogontum]